MGFQSGLTFVFTDIEGSTQLLRDMPGFYGLALRVHRRILATAFEEHGGAPMGSEGDGLFYVFTEPVEAARAAVAAQQRVEHYDWPDGLRLRIRVGIHCGQVTISDGEYVGLTVHEAARLCAAAHGGQILCSEPIGQAVAADPDDLCLHDLGLYMLRGFPDARRLFQVSSDGLETEFPPPREAVRAGGTRVSMWRREPAAAPGVTSRRASPTSPLAPADTLEWQVLHPGVDVEIGRASSGAPGAFRLIIRVDGEVSEEYDGLTVDGVTGAAAIVNGYSRLIHIASPVTDRGSPRKGIDTALAAAP